MAGHFLAVVIQLLAGQRHLHPARGEARLDALEQAAHLGVALLHRQLEVDHRLAAQPLAQPGLDQRGILLLIAAVASLLGFRGVAGASLPVAR